MDLKICFIDIETTGLSHEHSAIHQIAGMIDINGEIKEMFDIKLAPHPGAHISFAALEASHVTEEQIKGYPSMAVGYHQLLKILEKYVQKFNKKDKFLFAGYNSSSFDMPMMRKFWERNADNFFGSLFWSASLDVYVLAAELLKYERHTMVNFQLGTVAQQLLNLEISEEKLHDGAYDIALTRELYYTVTNRLRNGKHS